MPASNPPELRRRPQRRALEWAAAAIGDGARVLAARRLRGGSSSAVHALTIETATGRRHRLVLRRFVRADWLEREPDLAPREAAALTLLERSDVPAPRLVALDATGAEAGVPAVLMTHLPGRVDLAPADLTAHLRALAELLPRIHSLRGATGAVPPYRRYDEAPAVPAGVRDPRVWRTLLARASATPPDAPSRFIHRDYHPGNVLWSRSCLTGIVDWVSASTGPSDVDAGHARWNLALLHGVRAADEFLAAWLAAVGRQTHDPYWDVVCLLDAGPTGPLEAWRDAARIDLTAEDLHRRRDEYARSLAHRL
ncbi:MAG: phosphotransferase family protein [Dehalococcoidia bacterium]